jgi:uncharacterized protein (DUF1330 family)
VVGSHIPARGGTTELVEGGPELKWVVIREFADKEAIKRCYNSTEYQIDPARPARQRDRRAFIVEGVS